MAPKMSYFESLFWDRHVLQASHSAPAIRHAMLALSSVHEKLRLGNDAVEQSATCERFAISQYNQAVNLLLKESFDADQQPNFSVILSSCLLFISLEFLLGNYESALAHFRSGLRILCSAYGDEEYARGPIRDSNECPVPPTLDRGISNIFARLDAQGILLGYPVPKINMLPCCDDPAASYRTNRPFTLVMDARIRLHGICFAIYRFLCEAEDMTPTAITATRTKYSSYLKAWRDTFDTFTARSGASLSPRDQNRADVLRIHYEIFTIRLATGTSRREKDFDRFNSAFNDINRLIEGLIDPFHHGISSQDVLPVLSLDMGVVAPMYFTAIKCRDHNIRQKAIDLLELWPCRESVWDQRALAKLARKAMEIEELGTTRRNGVAVIPDAARVHRIDIELLELPRRLKASLHRRADLEPVEEMILW